MQLQWLRRLVRNNTTRIPETTAEKWKRRLSFAYALIAWNAFGFVCYEIYSGKADWAKYYGIKNEDDEKLTPGQQWARTLGVKNAEIYRVSGFKVEKVADKEIKPQ